jgi:hypothetical protein
MLLPASADKRADRADLNKKLQTRKGWRRLLLSGLLIELGARQRRPIHI